MIPLLLLVHTDLPNPFMSKKTKKQESIILPKLIKQVLSFTGIYLSVLTLLFLSALNLKLYSAKINLNREVLGASVATTYSPTLEEEIIYWQEIITKAPTYRDAYLELSDIYAQLGDIKQSEAYYQKARELDPNTLSSSN